MSYIWGRYWGYEGEGQWRKKNKALIELEEKWGGSNDVWEEIDYENFIQMFLLN